MRLAWSTDTHFDHGNLKRDPSAFGRGVAEAGADALVLTGDIAEAASVSKCIIDIRQAFGRPVYFVLGNHDVWGQSHADLRDKARRLARRYEGTHWLTEAGVIHLSDRTALVGLDGWYDARWGHVDPPKTRMGDWSRIKDYGRIWGQQAASFEDRVATITEMCRDRAEMLTRFFEPVLIQSLAERPEVLVATHVPPYPQNATYHGHHRDYEDDRDWLPWYTNKALGDVLLRVAEEHPDRKIKVLCGHAHWKHDQEILPNLRVVTGEADYGKPTIVDVLDV